VIPKIAGTVRNRVWEEAANFIRMYGTLGQMRGSYMGATLADAELTRRRDTSEEARDFRWPREHHARMLADFSDGIYGCRSDQTLDENYRLIVGGFESENNADLDADAGTLAALVSRGIEHIKKDDGAIRGQLIRRANIEWLAMLLESDDGIETQYSDQGEIRDYLRFMIARHAPAELIGAELRLAAATGCGFNPVSVELSMPPAELRITLIENVSGVPLPIAALVEGVHTRSLLKNPSV
jgi:hypothetical protein